MTPALKGHRPRKIPGIEILRTLTPHLGINPFRLVVLRFFRKGYSEALLRQGTEIFLRCLINALRHFGGVPKVFNVDNLKAAVPRADWFDSDICRHCGNSYSPCTPQHKGKAERGIDYVKDSALKGHDLENLAAEESTTAPILKNSRRAIRPREIVLAVCKKSLIPKSNSFLTLQLSNLRRISWSA